MSHERDSRCCEGLASDPGCDSPSVSGIMSSMDATEDFEDLVAEALEELPEFFRAHLDNVIVVVEEWPDRGTLHSAGVRYPSQLLGFYHGVPQTGRTSYYGLVTPDKISIYQRPIELQCNSREELRNMVKHVVLHEIAHHFGIDDDRLKTIGAY